MFGLSPADEVRKGRLNMAINIACWHAHVEAENEEYNKASDKSADQAYSMNKFVEQMKEEQTSRG